MTRVISGAVLLVGALAALWFLPPIYLVGIAAVVSLLAFREYADIAARAGARVSRPAVGMATILLCVAVAVPGLPIEVALIGMTLGLGAVALATASAGSPEGAALRDAAFSTFAPLY
ncbi:MAG: phosphatidate cytidylyltransferase, partial [Acidobacteria bacterium]|nr:phosphatidate cytidylyltransferase [Acidobacteriota bacterium]